MRTLFAAAALAVFFLTPCAPGVAAAESFLPPEIVALDRLPDPPAEPEKWGEYGDMLERDHATAWRAALKGVEARLDARLTGEVVVRTDIDIKEPCLKFNSLRAAARRLAALGYARARAGDSSASAACHRINLKLSAGIARDAFGGPPMLISHMIAIAIANIACDATNRSLVFRKISQGDLLSIARTFDRIDRLIPSFAHVVRQEHEILLAMVEAMKDDPAVRAKLAASEVADKVRRRIDEMTKPVFDAQVLAVEAPFFEGAVLRKEALATINQLVEECSNIGFFATLWNPVDTIARTLISIALPNMDRAFEQHVGMRARLRGTILSLGLAHHMSSGGATPGSLAAIPPLPGLTYANDPLSGAPFLFLPRNGKPLLYSVGWNLTDEGGMNSVSTDKDTVIYDAVNFAHE